MEYSLDRLFNIHTIYEYSNNLLRDSIIEHQNIIYFIFIHLHLY